MRFGQSTSAIARPGRGPAAMTRVGFQAPPPAGVPVRTGQAQVQSGAQQAACNTSSIIFQGMDAPLNLVPVGAGVPVVPGTLPVTFTPCEPVVVVDFEVTDPSGVLLISDIFTCRSHIFEGGFMSVNLLQSAATSRPGWMRALQRLILMQTVALTIVFRNPLTVGNPLAVQGGLLVVPIALNQALPPETEAALSRYNGQIAM